MDLPFNCLLLISLCHYSSRYNSQFPPIVNEHSVTATVEVSRFTCISTQLLQRAHNCRMLQALCHIQNQTIHIALTVKVKIMSFKQRDKLEARLRKEIGHLPSLQKLRMNSRDLEGNLKESKQRETCFMRNSLVYKDM